MGRFWQQREDVYRSSWVAECQFTSCQVQGHTQEHQYQLDWCTQCRYKQKGKDSESWHPMWSRRLIFRYFDRIRNSTKIYNVLVRNILDRSQRNFAHVTTVTLLWHVQNFVVIIWACFKSEHYKFRWNFEFDRNIINGMGARAHYILMPGTS